MRESTLHQRDHKYPRAAERFTRSDFGNCSRSTEGAHVPRKQRMQDDYEGLRPDQLYALKIYAKQRGISLTQAVREAVTLYLRTPMPMAATPTARPIPQPIDADPYFRSPSHIGDASYGADTPPLPARDEPRYATPLRPPSAY